MVISGALGNENLELNLEHGDFLLILFGGGGLEGLGLNSAVLKVHTRAYLPYFHYDVHILSF